MKQSLKIGKLGEEWVAQWLTTQRWQILQQRWHCPWGEIDLIAHQEAISTLIFVEVKTRKQFNWDRQGIDAITPSKQAKIIQSAELFLSQYPQFADAFLRFDVALVSYSATHLPQKQAPASPCTQGYYFYLEQYLESAFEAI